MFITAPTALADTGDRVSHLANKISKIKTVANAPFRKCSSKVSHWVEMAEAKVAAGEAAESSSSAGASDGKNAKDIKAKKKTARNKKEEHDFEDDSTKLAAGVAAESSFSVAVDGKVAKDIKAKKTARKKKEEHDFEEDSTVVGAVDDEASIDDDDVSEYQPTQGEGDKFVVAERSPRPSRSSSRIDKCTKIADVDLVLGEVVSTGITRVVAARRRTKSRQTRKTRGVDVESGIGGDDRLDLAKGRRKRSKSYSINIDEKGEQKESIDFEKHDMCVGGVSTYLDTTVLRRNKKSNLSTFNAVEQNPPDSEHVALFADDFCEISPYRTESSTRQVKSPKTSSGKGEKLLQSGTDVSTSVEHGKVTNQYELNNTLESDVLEVEYHVLEEDNKEVDETCESVYDQSMLFTQAFTQAATSQFMQQSMDSSTSNSKGGSFGPIETDVGLKSIEMSTRTISGKRSGFCGNTTPSIKNSSHQNGDAGFDGSAAVTKVKNAIIQSNPEDNVTSCIELTTHGISKMDSASLLAEIQTQNHSQQSSTVSPETRASVAANFSAGVSRNISSTELANTLKAVGYHITEAAKMLESIVDYL
jgi:hypothetical protein